LRPRAWAANSRTLQRKWRHCRKKQGDARLGRPEMGRFSGDLGHEYAVAPGVETIECRGIGIELVIEHDQQLTRPHRTIKPASGRARHAKGQQTLDHG
jgi:hypothetical protein